MLVMSSSVLLALFSLVSVLNHCHSQDDDGIVISLRDRVFPNHGLVTTEDIGIDSTGRNLAVGLKCSTTYHGCCSDFTTITGSTRDGRSPSGVGSWLYAHGYTFYVPRQVDRPNYISGITRSGRAVYVFRNRESDNNRLYLFNGIWRCVIPDSSGTEQTKYIGIYSRGNNGTLRAISTIQFMLLNEDPVVFSLTFNTTGGPATYVTWTRDGVKISSLEDSQYTPSQLVVPNGGIYTAGDYSNILTVSGRLPGVYGVSVTNDRTTQPVTPTRNITIIDFAHSNISLNVARSQDLTSISVSWTLVNSSFMEYFSLYEVQYTVCHIWSSDCETVQSQRINEFAITQYTVSNLTLWTTYNFTVSAEFNTPTVNESTHILPTPVSTGYRTIAIVGLLAPEITSVIEVANITSVQVTWNQPEGGLAANEYVVSYRHLNGRDGQCSSFQDGGSETVRAEREGGSYNSILNLQAFSVYCCTVTARKNNGALHNITSFNFTTNSTVPSGAPQNLAIINSTSTSNCTSVTISWDSLECIHRNGLITHYIISYGRGRDGENNQVNVTVNITDQDDGGSFTASRIDNTKNYIFKVAAVNEAGVGMLANVTVSTQRNDEKQDSKSATTAGLTTVILIQFLALVICGVIIAIGAYKMKTLISKVGNTSAMKQSKEDGAAIYEEPDILTPTPALELEACPAYEVTKMK